MHIDDGDICLHVTEEEVNVLRQALARYEGPYRPDQPQNEVDKEHHARMLELADSMRIAIENMQEQRFSRERGQLEMYDYLRQ